MAFSVSLVGFFQVLLVALVAFSVGRFVDGFSEAVVFARVWQHFVTAFP